MVTPSWCRLFMWPMTSSTLQALRLAMWSMPASPNWCKCSSLLDTLPENKQQHIKYRFCWNSLAFVLCLWVNAFIQYANVTWMTHMNEIVESNNVCFTITVVSCNHTYVCLAADFAWRRTDLRSSELFSAWTLGGWFLHGYPRRGGHGVRPVCGDGARDESFARLACPMRCCSSVHTAAQPATGACPRRAIRLLLMCQLVTFFCNRNIETMFTILVWSTYVIYSTIYYDINQIGIVSLDSMIRRKVKWHSRDVIIFQLTRKYPALVGCCTPHHFLGECSLYFHQSPIGIDHYQPNLHRLQSLPPRRSRWQWSGLRNLCCLSRDYCSEWPLVAPHRCYNQKEILQWWDSIDHFVLVINFGHRTDRLSFNHDWYAR